MDSYKETELATEPAPKTTCDDNQDDVVASNGDSSAGPSSRPPLPQSTKQELSPQQMLRQSRVDLLATPPVPLRMKLRSRAGQEADRMSMVTNLSRAGSFKVKGLLPRFGRKRRRDLAGSPEMDPDTMSIGSSYSTASGLSTASTLTAGGAGRRKLRGLKTMKSTLRQVIKGPRHHMQSEMEIVESPCKKPKMDVPIYRPPQKQPARRKEQRRWVDTMDRSVDTLSKELVKRQEAIFEIIEHARAMQEDMKNVEVHYIGPMKNLGYITGDEKTVLFAGVPICLSFSEDVVEKLELLRSRDDGTIDCIGNTLSLCLPKLRQLVPCCARLAAAKELYDQKLAEPVVAAFLELCQQSPFSRKRSLWDFLDSQRSGLLKYPLLLKEVMKTTSDDHPDTPGLKKVLEELEAFITKLDKLTGEVTCQRTLEKLVFAHKERCSLVDSSQALLFSGLLKLSQGGHHVQVSGWPFCCRIAADRYSICGGFSCCNCCILHEPHLLLCCNRR